MAGMLTTVPAYRALAGIGDGQARRDAWVAQYEAAHPAVFERYYSRWGKQDRRAAAADAAPELVDVIVARESRMVALLGSLGDRLAPLGVDADELDTVLMVGGHTSNGWVTELEGRPTLFIALEFLTDGPGDEVLAVHEGLHAVHMRHGLNEGWPDAVGLAMFVEGLAVAVSRLALPGFADGMYLWHDDAHEDWVTSCAASVAAIKEFAHDHLDASDVESDAAGLFTNKALPGELPVRSGYWLGDLMVRDWLSRGTGISELLDLTQDQADARARGWIEEPNLLRPTT